MESRNLAMTEETWSQLDNIAKKENCASAQELIRQWIKEKIKELS